MEDDVLQDIELTCDQILKQVMTEKKSFTWKFQLQTKVRQNHSSKEFAVNIN